MLTIIPFHKSDFFVLNLLQDNSSIHLKHLLVFAYRKHYDTDSEVIQYYEFIMIFHLYAYMHFSDHL